MISIFLHPNNYQHDQQHRTKKHRPSASGALSIKQGIILFLACFITAWPIAIMLGLTFSLILIAYFFLTVFYSVYLKKLLLVDVIVLAEFKSKKG